MVGVGVVLRGSGAEGGSDRSVNKRLSVRGKTSCGR